jgi:hypothetical protein
LLTRNPSPMRLGSGASNTADTVFRILLFIMKILNAYWFAYQSKAKSSAIPYP